MRASSVSGAMPPSHPTTHPKTSPVVKVALAAIALTACVIMTVAFPPAILLVGGVIITALFLQCLGNHDGYTEPRHRNRPWRSFRPIATSFWTNPISRYSPPQQSGYLSRLLSSARVPFGGGGHVFSGPLPGTEGSFSTNSTGFPPPNQAPYTARDVPPPGTEGFLYGNDRTNGPYGPGCARSDRGS